MTVIVQTPYSASVANGVTTVFGFGFQLLDADDLQVSLDGVVQSSGFTINGIGVQSGGNVTFAAPPANNTLVEIQRQIPLERNTDYQLNGDLPSEQVDRDLDRLWQALQDQAYFAGLTIGLPPGDAAAPVTVPPVATRANSVLAFDGSGNAISIPTADVATVAANVASINTVAANIAGVSTVAANIGAVLDAPNQAAVATAQAGIATTQAGIATTQAGNAATSATNAATSATAAANSATAAAGSAAAAAASATAAQVRNKIEPIGAAVASNALTLTLNATILDFRSATLSSGAVNTRVVSSPISLVISSGSTLGTTNGVLSRLAVLAIDNAGTVELAVVNLSGGVNLNEQGVISTTAEGGAGAADSNNVVYSATARTNVPYRLLGFVESTQVTAGTWATAPSLVHASNPLSKWGDGYGQAWQAVTGSRAKNTNYTNTTGRKISVNIVVTTNSGNAQFRIDGALYGYGQSPAVGQPVNMYVEIPAGSVYALEEVGGTINVINNWAELR